MSRNNNPGRNLRGYYAALPGVLKERGITQKEWDAMPIDTRALIRRRHDELKLGIAIQKDKMCGRPKYAEDGFYGLAKTELELERQLGWPDASHHDSELTAALWLEIERKREALTAEAEEIGRYLDLQQEAAPILKRTGETLHGYIARRWEIEKTIASGDMLSAIIQICELPTVKKDPLVILRQVLAQSQAA